MTSISPWINEFHYDNDGADTNEFVEIAGEAGTDLTGFSLLFYNGSNGASYGTIDLSGIITDQSNGFGVLEFPRAGIQNGSPDGIALIDGTSVLEFLSYEGSFTAVNGLANGMTSTDIGVSELSSTALGLSLQLIGTGSTAADFSWTGPATESGGSINNGQFFVAVQKGVTSSVPDFGRTFILLAFSTISLAVIKHGKMRVERR